MHMFGERKYPLYYNVSWDDDGPSCPPPPKKEYVASDGKYVYRLEERSYSADFARLREKEPRIKLSNFDGCPHWYGLMYMPNGDSYELQCKITKAYMEEAEKMKGDWTGYHIGDWTNRFLNRSSVMSAFNLFKEMLS